MSYDPCPQCKRPTEHIGRLCNRCTGEIKDMDELVDRIMTPDKPAVQTPDPKRMLTRSAFGKTRAG